MTFCLWVQATSKFASILLDPCGRCNQSEWFDQRRGPALSNSPPECCAHFATIFIFLFIQRQLIRPRQSRHACEEARACLLLEPFAFTLLNLVELNQIKINSSPLAKV